MSARARTILAVSAVVQLVLAAFPDTMGDLLSYRSWTRTLALDGLDAAYWPAGSAEAAGLQPAVDYPPLFPYVLFALGKALHALGGAALQNDHLLDFLIRLPLVGANLLLAWLVHREALRSLPSAADASLALVALSPALIFDTAYWGQADALCILAALASIVFLVRGRPEMAWAAIAAAVLVKPLAAPLGLVVAVETRKRFGGRRALSGALCAVGVVSAAFLPFLAAGRLKEAVLAVGGQVDAMPFVSVNAHNLWWLVGRGLPWTEAAVRPLGLGSWKAVGLLLFGVVALWTLVTLWRSVDPRAAYVAAATITFGFFALSTHMHENHLVMAIPFLALASLGDPRLRPIAWAVSFASCGNMLLHDPYLTHLVRPLVPGSRLLLPQQLDVPGQLTDQLIAQGYPWVAAEIRGETSFIGLLGTLVNAQVLLLLFAAWLVQMRSGFDDARRARTWPSWRVSLPMAAAFVVATAIPFTRHASTYGSQHAVLVHFHDAVVRAGFDQAVGIRSWDLDGDRRYVLFVHPPSEVRYRVHIPEQATLRFGIAVDPAAWAPSRGDGVEFVVRVENEDGSRILFAREIDPKRDARDRRWHDAVLDLSSLAGREVTLVFETTGGAAGNIDFDWAGFSDPTLAQGGGR